MTELRKDNTLKLAAGLFVAGVIYLFLKEFQTIILPFFVALIIAFVFEPLYRWLREKRVPAAVSVVLILILIVVISNLVSLFVVTSVNSFQSELPKYQEKFVGIYMSFANLLETNPYYNQYVKSHVDLTGMVDKINFSGMVQSLLAGVVGIFSNYILILIYVIFILTEIGSIRVRIQSAFSSERAGTISDTISSIFTDIKKYIVGKTLINFTHAALVVIILWMFGADFAIVWGFLTFFMAFIPNIGAIIATILPFLSTLMQFDGIAIPLIILIMLVVIGNVLGNILEPKIFGNTLNLSPLLLILSLIFWGHVWGIVGMFLSVPIMSIIKIVLSKFESTKPIALLMSHEVRKGFGSGTKSKKQKAEAIKKDEVLKKDEEINKNEQNKKETE